MVTKIHYSNEFPNSLLRFEKSKSIHVLSVYRLFMYIIKIYKVYFPHPQRVSPASMITGRYRYWNIRNLAKNDLITAFPLASICRIM